MGQAHEHGDYCRARDGLAGVADCSVDAVAANADAGDASRRCAAAQYLQHRHKDYGGDGLPEHARVLDRPKQTASAASATASDGAGRADQGASQYADCSSQATGRSSGTASADAGGYVGAATQDSDGCAVEA